MQRTHLGMSAIDNKMAAVRTCEVATLGLVLICVVINRLFVKYKTL